MRNFELPGRSAVIARNAMVATSHPASTLAAINVLQEGGNAMDAAIAACAVQCVVEPGSTGIGGDCFALYSRKGTADIVAFDGAGWAPQAATAAALVAQGVTEIDRQSPHAITVPGAIDAWCRLARDHGTRPLAQLLEPAALLAHEGYAVAPRVALDWKKQEALLRADPAAAALLLVEGAAPTAGTVHRQPALAATLRAIGRDGRAAFYEGDIAQGILDTLKQCGGLHAPEDFAAFRGEYVEPVKTRFRGYDVHECPASGQGVIALLILNILRGFDASGDPLSPERLHREIEATRLAYSIRDAVLCDPRHGTVDTDWLLSDALADTLRNRIDPERFNPDVAAFVPPAHRDTVYISVVDKDRNCASFINSLFSPFGSGVMDRRSGVLFHNRGQSFSLTPGHPNALAPHKRPMHTIIPGMVTRDGRVTLSFGVMGGHYQAMGHAHFLSKVLDYGMDPQAAIDMPRLFPEPGCSSVEVESTFAPATIEALRRRGFTLVPALRPIGGAQAVAIDWEHGTLLGASDHRKDGCALGY